MMNERNDSARIQYLLKALTLQGELLQKFSDEAMDFNSTVPHNNPLYSLKFWQTFAAFHWQIMHDLESLGHKFTKDDWLGHSIKALCCRDNPDNKIEKPQADKDVADTD